MTAREIRITQQIQFDFNKATIKPVSFPILDAVYDVLAANPKITIEVQGHTDNVGQAAYNQKLSQQRAESVRSYLARKGIPDARLVAKGYGMAQPLVPNTSEPSTQPRSGLAGSRARRSSHRSRSRNVPMSSSSVIIRAYGRAAHRSPSRDRASQR